VNNWSNGSTANSILITSSGNYWLQSSNGQCSVSDSIVIAISDCEVLLEMPNVLTPNGDGKNDTFIPIKYKGIANATLKIFNRWGEELFSTTNVEEGWNGFSSSSVCTDGTYFWILQYRTITNKSDVQKGFLTLIK
jgi:gliding motility-associated-like protein